MITPNEVEDVLHYFYNNHDNRSGVISKKLNITVSKVNKIIEVHLSRKRNYMPSVTPKKITSSVHNRKPLKAYNEDGELLGEFTSFKVAGRELKVNPGCISKYFSGLYSGMFVNHKGGRKIRYELV